MKRLIFIITLLLSVSMYANAFEVDGIAYDINGDGVSVTVTSGGSKKTGTLTIPERVSYNSKTYSVTSIGHSAFYGCNGFTGSLTIPNSVTTIGDYAFAYCSGFTGSLFIPNSVTSIGECAFDSCSGFNGSLIIGNSVTQIENEAFFSCHFKGSLVIGKSVTNIGSDVFNVSNDPKEIYFLNPTPPNMGGLNFDFGLPKPLPLYVPADSYDEYSNWVNTYDLNLYVLKIKDNKTIYLVLDKTENKTIETSLFQVYPTIEPAAAASQKIAWKSSDEGIATVDSHGRIKALKPGKVTITATTTDGSNLSAQCEVTIMMKGDMNEDFVIDVTDMSSIINIILKGK